MGCEVSLRSRDTRDRRVHHRASVLTIKGLACWEVYTLAIGIAQELAMDLSRVTAVSVRMICVGMAVLEVLATLAPCCLLWLLFTLVP